MDLEKIVHVDYYISVALDTVIPVKGLLLWEQILKRWGG